MKIPSSKIPFLRSVNTGMLVQSPNIGRLRYWQIFICDIAVGSCFGLVGVANFGGELGHSLVRTQSFFY